VVNISSDYVRIMDTDAYVWVEPAIDRETLDRILKQCGCDRTVTKRVALYRLTNST